MYSLSAKKQPLYKKDINHPFFTITFLLSLLFLCSAICSASTPFTGTAYPVPATQIQAVNFDNGTGQNDAYFDSTAGNTGGVYRTTDVDIDNCADPGNGFCVGWTDQNEWLKYTINVITPGAYDLQVRVANPAIGRYMHFEIDDVNVTGTVPVVVNGTGNWTTYNTQTVGGFNLTSGTHVFKLWIEAPLGQMNFNWFKFVPHVSSTYYVSNSGSDSNNGTSSGTPWKTLAKVAATTLVPGDNVLLQRGSEWHEQLIANQSGSLGFPITYADYGTGNKPKLWGSDVLTNANFTSIGGNQYNYSISTPVNSVLCNHSFFDDQAPSGGLNRWSWASNVLTISSPTDPRTDGKVYTACTRVDEIWNNFKNHLAFRNLIVDETAKRDDGYGCRTQGGTDVAIDSCEAYHCGKHHYGCINSTQVIYTNCYAAYAMPGQGRAGNTAYVSFGDNTTPLTNQTSEYHNCTCDHPEDTRSGPGNEYSVFVDHGSNLGSVLMDNMRGLNSSEWDIDNLESNAPITIKGGLMQNNRLTATGHGNIVVDGLTITGPRGSIDDECQNLLIQNLVMYGSRVTDWFKTAVLLSATNPTLRFSTIVLDPTSPADTVCINNGTNIYGDILIGAPTVMQACSGTSYNLYVNGAQFTGSSPAGPGSIFVADPLFVNPSGGNYALQSGSAAINAVPTSAVPGYPATDANNAVRPSGGALDMGAYEFGGGIAAPVVSSAGSASGTVGASFSYQIIASNNPTSYGASSLPAGTSVNTSTGLISGTPTTATTYNSTVTATNFGGTGSKAVTISIGAAGPPAPVITSAGSASGTVGTAFSYQITATNSPTSYGASGLPAGVTVNSSTGLVSGTPSASGTSNANVTATNAGGAGSKGVTITISGGSGGGFNVNAIFTTGTAVTNGGADNFGNAYQSNLLGTSATFNGSSFTFGPANAPDAYSNVTVTLPAGTYTTLNMLGSAAGGNVTNQTFTVHYTDGTTSVFTQSLHDWQSSGSYAGESLVVTMATHLNSSGAAVTPAAYVHGYTFVLNGKSVQSITLPATRGVIAFGFAAGGATPAPVITSATTASGTVGAASTYNITATNSPTSYNATSLPAGLSVNTGTGAITGTPTTPGIYSVGISATNSGGTGSATLTMTINNTTTAFNINAIFTTGTAVTNGGADSFGNAYQSDQLGTSTTFDTKTFTFGAANALDGWSNTTVNLPAGNYTTLDMVGSAVGGNLTGKIFTVNYTDGTNSTFTIGLHDWESTSLNAGEVKVVTMADHLNTSGASATPGCFLHGYTFTLNGKPVLSMTLPATRQVIALGFAGR